MIVKDPY